MVDNWRLCTALPKKSCDLIRSFSQPPDLNNSKSHSQSLGHLFHKSKIVWIIWTHDTIWYKRFKAHRSRPLWKWPSSQIRRPRNEFPGQQDCSWSEAFFKQPGGRHQIESWHVPFTPRKNQYEEMRQQLTTSRNTKSLLTPYRASITHLYAAYLYDSMPWSLRQFLFMHSCLHGEWQWPSNGEEYEKWLKYSLSRST